MWLPQLAFATATRTTSTPAAETLLLLLPWGIARTGGGGHKTSQE